MHSGPSAPIRHIDCFRVMQAASVTIAAAFAAFMAWAYVPDPILQAIGLTYYPAKEWAVSLPAWVLTACAAAICVYEGLNIMGIPSLDSPNQTTLTAPGMTDGKVLSTQCELTMSATNLYLYQGKYTETL